MTSLVHSVGRAAGTGAGRGAGVDRWRRSSSVAATYSALLVNRTALQYAIAAACDILPPWVVAVMSSPAFGRGCSARPRGAPHSAVYGWRPTDPRDSYSAAADRGRCEQNRLCAESSCRVVYCRARLAQWTKYVSGRHLRGMRIMNNIKGSVSPSNEFP